MEDFPTGIRIMVMYNNNNNNNNNYKVDIIGSIWHSHLEDGCM